MYRTKEEEQPGRFKVEDPRENSAVVKVRDMKRWSKMKVLW